MENWNEKNWNGNLKWETKMENWNGKLKWKTENGKLKGFIYCNDDVVTDVMVKIIIWIDPSEI